MAEMILIEHDWSCHDLIFCKDTGNGTAAFRDDQRKIEQAGFLDAAMHTGGAKADRRCNASGVVLAHADLRIRLVGELGIGGRGAQAGFFR
jgi:hypothetical protein